MSGELECGVCGTACSCAGCLIGTTAGALVWAYVIWPKMGENEDLEGLGQWLMTFLGPGEAFVSAFATAGTLALAVAACALAACMIKDRRNPRAFTLPDLERGDSLSSLPEEQEEQTGSDAKLRKTLENHFHYTLAFRGLTAFKPVLAITAPERTSETLTNIQQMEEVYEPPKP